MKTKIFAKIALVTLFTGFMFILPIQAARALPVVGPGTGTTSTSSSSSNKGSSTLTNQELENNLRSNPILIDIQKVVDVLSAGVAIVVVAMIIVGGIQYAIAGDNSSAVSAAKKRIINALIALFAFIFMFSFIEWLIPGGIFG